MDIVNQAKALKLAKRFMDMSAPVVPVIPFRVQKKDFSFEKSKTPIYFDKTAGLEAERILRFVNSVIEDPDLDIHNIAISKNGKLAFYISAPGYDAAEPHAVHSMSKSVTSLAVGILIDEGKLSLTDKLGDVMGSHMSPLEKLNCRNITVESLLTMTTGVTFNESCVYSEDDYLSGYFGSTFKFSPGKRFEYNSLNTYMLGAIVKEITKKDLSDFVEERIFSKAGINNYHWEKCPKGLSKGGWGLYLSVLDSLKLGELYLDGGRDIVSRDWIKKATSAKVRVGDECGNYNYGYQVWCAKNHKGFLLNGMFGQDVFCYPDENICLAVNGGLSDFFQQCSLYEKADAVFLKDGAKDGKKIGKGKLLKIKKRFVNKQGTVMGSPTLKTAFYKRELCDRAYVLTSQNRFGASIMPKVLQVVQNNYSKGMSEINFEMKGRKFYAVFNEGGEDKRLLVGFGAPERQKVDFSSEIYSIAVLGAFAKDEEGDLVLKLRISFTETANSRVIKMYFKKDGSLRMDMWENPALDFAFDNTEYFLKDIPIKSLRNTITNTIEGDTVKYIYEKAFCPTVFGKLKL